MRPPVQLAIKSWAEEHIEQVHAARDRYDAVGTEALGDATGTTSPARRCTTTWSNGSSAPRSWIGCG
jgi:hypothetical protein